MKPAFVINRGDTFVTLRATTDRPAEIREALATREVQHVFKGDQNQAWDAVLSNHCLARAIGSPPESDARLTFFVQDERMGTSDARLARLWRSQGRQYVLTEDYYRGRAGAVWEHQDVSHGLFFTEAVSPEQFAEAGVHLHRAADAWERHADTLASDLDWRESLGSLGVSLPAPGRDLAPDAATGLGPAVYAETLDGFFGDQPAAALYYAFTKTDGLYGIAPVDNDNLTMSSIPAQCADLLAAGRRLLLLTARGAMRAAGNAAQRRGIKQRVRGLAQWSATWLDENPRGSVTDFQIAFGQWLTNEVFPADRLELDRTSRFTHVAAPSAAAPPDAGEESLHFFLDLALRHPAEFSDAYNAALNKVGYGLQRIKWDPKTGVYTPPFFVEFAPRGAGTSLYRYGLELSGVNRTSIRLVNGTIGDIVVEGSGAVRCLDDFLRALFSGGRFAHGFSLVGKAAAFASELQRSPRGLGLPRQGSKYTPMVDHFLAGLRERGVLKQAPGLRIRIGLNALDRLDAMGETPLRLPRFLRGPLGRQVTCTEFSRRWRGVTRDAQRDLRLLGQTRVGQQPHVARLLAINARRQNLAAAAASDPRLAKLLRQLGWPDCPDAAGLGAELSPQAAATIERLLAERDALLAARRLLVGKAQATYAAGRLQPDEARLAELEASRERVDCALQLLVAAYVRRLWQRAESLTYLNDRPYTLALFLLYGRDIFPPICRDVEFDVEYISPCLSVTRLDSAPALCGAAG